MSNVKIQQALANLFEKQRIVFWYDARATLPSIAQPTDSPAAPTAVF